MSGKNQPTAFHFSLSLGDEMDAIVASFSEVSGLSSAINADEILEGGANNFIYRVPSAIKNSNLGCKRGIAMKNSPLTNWCKEILLGNTANTLETKTIIVTLRDENNKPAISWRFVNAYPVEWTAIELNENDNHIAIESVDFRYTYFERIA